MNLYSDRGRPHSGRRGEVGIDDRAHGGSRPGRSDVVRATTFMSLGERSVAEITELES